MTHEEIFSCRICDIFKIYFAENPPGDVFENFYHCRPLTFLKRTSSRVFSCSKSEISLSDGNTRTICEICSKLTIKTPKWRQWPRSGVFIVNFEQISHGILVFPLLTLSK